MLARARRTERYPGCRRGIVRFLTEVLRTSCAGIYLALTIAYRIYYNLRSDLF